MCIQPLYYSLCNLKLAQAFLVNQLFAINYFIGYNLDAFVAMLMAYLPDCIHSTHKSMCGRVEYCGFKQRYEVVWLLGVHELSSFLFYHLSDFIELVGSPVYCLAGN